MDGRVREGAPDRVEQRLVPAPGDRPLGVRWRRAGTPAPGPRAGRRRARRTHERRRRRRRGDRDACSRSARSHGASARDHGRHPPGVRVRFSAVAGAAFARAARSRSTSVAMLPRLNARSIRGGVPSRIAAVRSSTSARTWSTAGDVDRRGDLVRATSSATAAARTDPSRNGLVEDEGRVAADDLDPLAGRAPRSRCRTGRAGRPGSGAGRGTSGPRRARRTGRRPPTRSGSSPAIRRARLTG